MKSRRASGILLITGAIGVLIPYTILTITFHYPDILREKPGIVLEQFHAGGVSLIFTWLAFALPGLPLLVAYVLLGKELKSKTEAAEWITAMGVISIVAQLVGLLRWVFVVPMLATAYASTTDVSLRQSIEVVFQTVHQLGGVLLGEHIGQLFTVIWSVSVAVLFQKHQMLPSRINYFGIISSLIYFLAQAELLATVIPDFPVWDLAGFVGSTLWLVWLVVVGYYQMKKAGC
jgi:Domain of unknown function (DUF4386)